MGKDDLQRTITSQWPGGIIFEWEIRKVDGMKLVMMTVNFSHFRVEGRKPSEVSLRHSGET